MKKHPFFLIAVVLLLGACEKTVEAPAVLNDDPLLGYWKLVRYEADNIRVYARVPDDDGLNDMQKNQMLRFLPPDQFGEFFWNWCLTPPDAMPSEWWTGSWQRRANAPEILDVTPNGVHRVMTILEQQPDSLMLRYGS